MGTHEVVPDPREGTWGTAQCLVGGWASLLITHQTRLFVSWVFLVGFSLVGFCFVFWSSPVLKLALRKQPLRYLKAKLTHSRKKIKRLKSWGREEPLRCEWPPRPKPRCEPTARDKGTFVLLAAVRTSQGGSNSSHKRSSGQGWRTSSWAIKYEAPEPQILPQTEVLNYLCAPV